MPYLMVRTNAEVDRHEERLARLSKAVAGLLGKSEQYVMVSLEDRVPLLFAGSGEPAAYLELKSIGLPEQRTAELSEQLCGLVGGELGIGSERIYVEFANAQRHLWGWNGGTF